MNAHADVNAWLDIATRGLPRHIKRAVYDELLAHYEDAYQDQQAEGADAAKAHHTALAQLGDAAEISRGLRETHLGHRRYGWAVGISIVSMLYLVLGAFMVSIHPLIFSLVGAAFMVFLLRTFRRLVDAHLREPSLEFGLALVQIGLIVAAAVGWLGYRQPFAYPTVLIFTDPMVLPRLDSFSYDWSPVYALLIVAVSLTGIGWIVIGDRLSAAHSSLHGLGVLLRTVMLVNGLGLIGSGLLLTLGNLAALAPIALLVGITGVTRQALMTLLFFRAARRASRRPAGGLFA